MHYCSMNFIAFTIYVWLEKKKNVSIQLSTHSLRGSFLDILSDRAFSISETTFFFNVEDSPYRETFWQTDNSAWI